MKWPSWLPWARTVDTGPDEPEERATPEQAEDADMTPSDATLRAEAAARAAGLRLQESRDRRGTVDEQASTVRRLVSENHFADMIRNALGSGT